MKFTAQMRDFFRSSDIIVRLGGEEFAILIGGSTLLNATEKLDAFRKKIEQAPVLAAPDKPISFTISVGLAECPKGGKYNVEALLKQADTCLYQAKKTGRNRVSFSSI